MEKQKTTVNERKVKKENTPCAVNSTVVTFTLQSSFHSAGTGSRSAVLNGADFSHLNLVSCPTWCWLQPAVDAWANRCRVAVRNATPPRPTAISQPSLSGVLRPSEMT